MASLYVGMGPPYYVRARIAATSDFPTGSIASVLLIATKPISRTVVQWATVIFEQNSSFIRVGHALASSDLDEAGNWTLFARTDAGRETEDKSFRVVARGQR